MNKEKKYFNFDLQGSDEEMLLSLQSDTFNYFVKETNATTGLISDSTHPGCPASIAVVGMAISTYIVGVEENLMPRQEAIERILKIFRFLIYSEQSTSPTATGYKGFYYHFLDMQTGRRAWQSELSTIDTALLIAGVLSAVTYFSNDDEKEKEIRSIGEQLYLRVDWVWALNGGKSITHGWKPKSGFLRYRWNDNYSEALILYILALGSPTFGIHPEGYNKWTSTFTEKEIYSFQYTYAGPLFIHQFSHLWIDFQGIRDAHNQKTGYDYFENSRRATLIHRQYAIENPLQFEHYSAFCWGLTASDGPGRKTTMINGVQRPFFGYKARGAPFGPDDGTISPWAVVASLPFAPDIVLETTRHSIEKFSLMHHHHYGLDASFNPTYPEKKTNSFGWVSPWKFGLNQAPVIMMIANYRKAFIWDLMKNNKFITTGLLSASFTGGWIDTKKK